MEHELRRTAAPFARAVTDGIYPYIVLCFFIVISTFCLQIATICLLWRGKSGPNKRLSELRYS